MGVVTEVEVSREALKNSLMFPGQAGGLSKGSHICSKTRGVGRGFSGGQEKGGGVRNPHQTDVPSSADTAALCFCDLERIFSVSHLCILICK